MTYVVPALLRFAGLLSLWQVLAEGSLRYLQYGLPVVVVCTALSLRLSPPVARPYRRRPWEIPALLGWYLVQMFVGGVDVARRALRRHVDVDPHVLVLDVVLPEGMVRRVAMGMFNLMPGAMVRRDLGDRVEIHELAPHLDARGSWAELTRRLGRIAGTEGPQPKSEAHNPDGRPPGS